MLTIWGISTGYSEGWVARADVPVVLKVVGGFMVVNETAGFVKNKIVGKNE